MTDTEITEPTAFVRFARKTSPVQYETSEASLSLPVPIPPEGIASQPFLAAVDGALADAKVSVLTVLAVPFHIDQATGQVVEDTPPPPPVQQQQRPQGGGQRGGGGAGRQGGGQRQQSSGGGGGAEDRPCGFCGGDTYNNTKRQKRNPNGPDFKCKDGDNCGAAMWLTKDGDEGEWKP